MEKCYIILTPEKELRCAQMAGNHLHFVHCEKFPCKMYRQIQAHWRTRNIVQYIRQHIKRLIGKILGRNTV